MRIPVRSPRARSRLRPGPAVMLGVLATAVACGAAKAQQTVAIGNARPEVEVNEDAIFYDVPGYYRSPATSLPLYDPARGRIVSRVIALQPPGGAARPAPLSPAPSLSAAPPPAAPTTAPQSRVVELPPAPKAEPRRVSPAAAPPAATSARPLSAPTSRPARKATAPAAPPPVAKVEAAPAPAPRAAPRQPVNVAPVAPPAAAQLTTPAATKTPPPPPPAAPAAAGAELAAVAPPAAVPKRPAPAAPVAARASDALTVLFAPGEAKLPGDAENKLQAVAAQIGSDQRARVQLRAYASSESSSSSAARRLSLSRALTVRSFLIEAGVSSTRIDVRALGAKFESGPADRVDLVIVN